MSTGIFQPGSISPLTTKGDLYGFSTGDAKIPVGSNNQVLIADSTQALGLKWGAVSAAAVMTVSSTAKTSGFTAIGNNAYLVDASAGTFLITADVASGYSGQMMSFTRVDNTPSKPISLALGLTTVHLNTIQENWTVFSNGVNWTYMSHYAQTAWATYGVSISATTTAPILPTNGNTLNIARWRRNGPEMELRWIYCQGVSVPGATNGSGTYKFTLPNALAASADVAVAATFGSAWPHADIIAEMMASNVASLSDQPFVGQMYDTSNIIFLQSGSNATWSSGTIGIENAGGDINISIKAKIPIALWEP